LPKPDGIENVLIDPQSGLRADFACSGAVELPFALGSAPVERAPCASAVGAAVEGVKQQAKNWMQRLFGR
jgi:penicillin-binding protein 1B